ncbi:MAG: glycogen synthase, partial [Chthoniobacterales bacterium]
GYNYSCWVEKRALEMADAIIAVSAETKQDILTHFNVEEERVSVIYNGIDYEEYQQQKNHELLKRWGIDPARPYILFVGRVTRQKGIMHFLRAIKKLDPGFQVVLCASAPDTPEVEAEVETALAEAQSGRQGVIWIQNVVEHQEIIALYSSAAVFVCPSIYEPFGIINLEAMACGVPVVATAVGGIKEVVIDEITGFLVPLEQATKDLPEEMVSDVFEETLAERINQLMADPGLRTRMGAAGRRRVESHFSWDAVAKKTEKLYQAVLNNKSNANVL